jgi:flagellar basal-body rod protein FlgB
MIDRIVDSNSLPALERALQFASGRHRLIANNLANIETPGYRPLDVPVGEFQAQLADALATRRAALAEGLGPEATRGADGGLALFAPGPASVGPSGLVLEPTPIADSLLYHDGNDRSLERILQSLTENVLMFRFAATMARRHFSSIDAAIRERL